MKTEIVTCDIEGCRKENPEKPNTTLDVIFTTDQTEGRSVKPYLSKQTIDLCQGCMDIILQGYYIKATGAQGHNEYKLKN